MVVSYDGNGTVYSFKPDALDEEVTLLKPEKASRATGNDSGASGELLAQRE